MRPSSALRSVKERERRRSQLLWRDIVCGTYVRPATEQRQRLPATIAAIEAAYVRKGAKKASRVASLDSPRHIGEALAALAVLRIRYVAFRRSMPLPGVNSQAIRFRGPTRRYQPLQGAIDTGNLHEAMRMWRLGPRGDLLYYHLLPDQEQSHPLHRALHTGHLHLFAFFVAVGCDLSRKVAIFPVCGDDLDGSSDADFYTPKRLLARLAEAAGLQGNSESWSPFSKMIGSSEDALDFEGCRRRAIRHMRRLQQCCGGVLSSEDAQWLRTHRGPKDVKSLVKFEPLPEVDAAGRPYWGAGASIEKESANPSLDLCFDEDIQRELGLLQPTSDSGLFFRPRAPLRTVLDRGRPASPFDAFVEDDEAASLSDLRGAHQLAASAKKRPSSTLSMLQVKPLHSAGAGAVYEPYLAAAAASELEAGSVAAGMYHPDEIASDLQPLIFNSIVEGARCAMPDRDDIGGVELAICNLIKDLRRRMLPAGAATSSFTEEGGGDGGSTLEGEDHPEVDAVSSLHATDINVASAVIRIAKTVAQQQRLLAGDSLKAANLAVDAMCIETVDAASAVLVPSHDASVSQTPLFPQFLGRFHLKSDKHALSQDHPLLHAVHNGRAGVVRLLLRLGFDASVVGTCHPWSGDDCIVEELQRISPLDLVQLLRVRFYRNRRWKEVLSCMIDDIRSSSAKQVSEFIRSCAEESALASSGPVLLLSTHADSGTFGVKDPSPARTIAASIDLDDTSDLNADAAAEGGDSVPQQRQRTRRKPAVPTLFRKSSLTTIPITSRLARLSVHDLRENNKLCGALVSAAEMPAFQCFATKFYAITGPHRHRTSKDIFSAEPDEKSPRQRHQRGSSGSRLDSDAESDFDSSRRAPVHGTAKPGRVCRRKLRALPVLEEAVESAVSVDVSDPDFDDDITSRSRLGVIRAVAKPHCHNGNGRVMSMQTRPPAGSRIFAAAALGGDRRGMAEAGRHQRHIRAHHSAIRRAERFVGNSKPANLLQLQENMGVEAASSDDGDIVDEYPILGFNVNDSDDITADESEDSLSATALSPTGGAELRRGAANSVSRSTRHVPLLGMPSGTVQIVADRGLAAACFDDPEFVFEENVGVISRERFLPQIACALSGDENLRRRVQHNRVGTEFAMDHRSKLTVRPKSSRNVKELARILGIFQSSNGHAHVAAQISGHHTNVSKGSLKPATAVVESRFGSTDSFTYALMQANHFRHAEVAGKRSGGATLPSAPAALPAYNAKAHDEPMLPPFLSEVMHTTGSDVLGLAFRESRNDVDGRVKGVSVPALDAREEPRGTARNAARDALVLDAAKSMLFYPAKMSRNLVRIHRQRQEAAALLRHLALARSDLLAAGAAVTGDAITDLATSNARIRLFAAARKVEVLERLALQLQVNSRAADEVQALGRARGGVGPDRGDGTAIAAVAAHANHFVPTGFASRGAAAHAQATALHVNALAKPTFQPAKRVHFSQTWQQFQRRSAAPRSDEVILGDANRFCTALRRRLHNGASVCPPPSSGVVISQLQGPLYAGLPPRQLSGLKRGIRELLDYRSSVGLFESHQEETSMCIDGTASGVACITALSAHGTTLAQSLVTTENSSQTFGAGINANANSAAFSALGLGQFAAEVQLRQIVAPDVRDCVETVVPDLATTRACADDSLPSEKRGAGGILRDSAADAILDARVKWYLEWMQNQKRISEAGVDAGTSQSSAEHLVREMLERLEQQEQKGRAALKQSLQRTLSLKIPETAITPFPRPYCVPAQPFAGSGCVLVSPRQLRDTLSKSDFEELCFNYESLGFSSQGSPTAIAPLFSAQHLMVAGLIKLLTPWAGVDVSSQRLEDCNHLPDRTASPVDDEAPLPVLFGDDNDEGYGHANSLRHVRTVTAAFVERIEAIICGLPFSDKPEVDVSNLLDDCSLLLDTIDSAERSAGSLLHNIVPFSELALSTSKGGVDADSGCERVPSPAVVPSASDDIFNSTAFLTSRSSANESLALLQRVLSAVDSTIYERVAELLRASPSSVVDIGSNGLKASLNSDVSLPSTARTLQHELDSIMGAALASVIALLGVGVPTTLSSEKEGAPSGADSSSLPLRSTSRPCATLSGVEWNARSVVPSLSCAPTCYSCGDTSFTESTSSSSWLLRAIAVIGSHACLWIRCYADLYGLSAGKSEVPTQASCLLLLLLEQLQQISTDLPSALLLPLSAAQKSFLVGVTEPARHTSTPTISVDAPMLSLCVHLQAAWSAIQAHSPLKTMLHEIFSGTAASGHPRSFLCSIGHDSSDLLDFYAEIARSSGALQMPSLAQDTIHSHGVCQDRWSQDLQWEASWELLMAMASVAPFVDTVCSLSSVCAASDDSVAGNALVITPSLEQTSCANEPSDDESDDGASRCKVADKASMKKNVSTALLQFSQQCIAIAAGCALQIPNASATSSEPISRDLGGYYSSTSALLDLVTGLKAAAKTASKPGRPGQARWLKLSLAIGATSSSAESGLEHSYQNRETAAAKISSDNLRWMTHVAVRTLDGLDVRLRLQPAHPYEVKIRRTQLPPLVKGDPPRHRQIAQWTLVNPPPNGSIGGVRVSTGLNPRSLKLARALQLNTLRVFRSYLQSLSAALSFCEADDFVTRFSARSCYSLATPSCDIVLEAVCGLHDFVSQLDGGPTVQSVNELESTVALWDLKSIHDSSIKDESTSSRDTHSFIVPGATVTTAAQVKQFFSTGFLIGTSQGVVSDDSVPLFPVARSSIQEAIARLESKAGLATSNGSTCDALHSGNLERLHGQLPLSSTAFPMNGAVRVAPNRSVAHLPEWLLHTAIRGYITLGDAEQVLDYCRTNDASNVLFQCSAGLGGCGMEAVYSGLFLWDNHGARAISAFEQAAVFEQHFLLCLCALYALHSAIVTSPETTSAKLLRVAAKSGMLRDAANRVCPPDMLGAIGKRQDVQIVRRWIANSFAAVGDAIASTKQPDARPILLLPRAPEGVWNDLHSPLRKSLKSHAWLQQTGSRGLLAALLETVDKIDPHSMSAASASAASASVVFQRVSMRRSVTDKEKIAARERVERLVGQPRLHVGLCDATARATQIHLIFAAAGNYASHEAMSGSGGDYSLVRRALHELAAIAFASLSDMLHRAEALRWLVFDSTRYDDREYVLSMGGITVDNLAVQMWVGTSYFSPAAGAVPSGDPLQRAVAFAARHAALTKRDLAVVQLVADAAWGFIKIYSSGADSPSADPCATLMKQGCIASWLQASTRSVVGATGLIRSKSAAASAAGGTTPGPIFSLLVATLISCVNHARGGLEFWHSRVNFAGRAWLQEGDPRAMQAAQLMPGFAEVVGAGRVAAASVHRLLCSLFDSPVLVVERPLRTSGVVAVESIGALPSCASGFAASAAVLARDFTCRQRREALNLIFLQAAVAWERQPPGLDSFLRLAERHACIAARRHMLQLAAAATDATTELSRVRWARRMHDLGGGCGACAPEAIRGCSAKAVFFCDAALAAAAAVLKACLHTGGAYEGATSLGAGIDVDDATRTYPHLLELGQWARVIVDVWARCREGEGEGAAAFSQRYGPQKLGAGAPSASGDALPWLSFLGFPADSVAQGVASAWMTRVVWPEMQAAHHAASLRRW